MHRNDPDRQVPQLGVGYNRPAMRAGLRARCILLDLVCRAVTGRPLDRTERLEAETRIALDGFRKAARASLVRRMARAAFRSGGATILAPALDGLFTVAVPASDFGVGWEILEHGTYEPHVVAFYRRCLRPGMRVLDVGANVGFHALHAASLAGPSGRVVAIEPDPVNASLLRLSVSLARGGAPVEVVEAALSDRDGEVTLSDLGNAANSGARFTHPDRRALERQVHGPSPRFETVRAIRWDDHFGGFAVDLVKLDVEGAEPRVLRGMERSIERHRPVIVSELAPSNLASLGGVEPGDYLAWFRERGYALSILREDGTEGPLASAADALAAVGERHHIELVFRPVPVARAELAAR